MQCTFFLGLIKLDMVVSDHWVTLLWAMIQGSILPIFLALQLQRMASRFDYLSAGREKTDSRACEDFTW